MARAMVADSRANQERIIAAVKHAISEGRCPNGVLPSYRQLSRELNVTMSNVRRAMTQMEMEGIVRREANRGVFLRKSPSANANAEASSIRYLTFIVATPPGSSFVDVAYLKGHAEALEGRDVRARHLSLTPDEHNFDRLLASDGPLEGQGYVLVNYLSPSLMRWFLERKVPFVVQCFGRYNTTGMPAHHRIFVNKAGGASEAVNHLIRLGHRHIGFIGALEPADDPSTRPFEGYRAAMECAGLGYRPEDLGHYEGDDPVAVGPIVTSILQRPDRPSAIMASNDNLALGTIAAARSLGLRIPEDVSVAGINDQPGVGQANPPLTTVAIPRLQLARGAVEMLFEVAERRSGFEQRVLECHLIVRKSTAPPSTAAPR